VRYSVHPTRNDDDGPMLILMEFTSAEAFAAHSTRVARQVPKIAELLRAPLALFGPRIGAGAVHFGLIATFWILAINP
jgi:hypothetical protein